MGVLLSDVSTTDETAFAVLAAQQDAALNDFFDQPGNGPIDLATTPLPRSSNPTNLSDTRISVDMAPIGRSEFSDGFYLDIACSDPLGVGIRYYFQTPPAGSAAPTDTKLDTGAGSTRAT